MKYRKLTEEEIRIFEQNRCSARDWGGVTVEDGGTGPAEVKGAVFEGEVRLGDGCRVVDSVVAGCTVGRGSEILRVGRIENYDVGEGCRIFNCGSMVAREYAAKGCGTTVDVLDETGGRRITICPAIGAQTAYMMVFYRHNAPLTAALESLVEAWGTEHRTRTGRIGDGVTICYVTRVEDVDIGDRSVVRSAVKLLNGTVGVGAQILENVCAEDFILSDKAILGTTCVAKHVFIGQNCHIDNGFVAHNSLIFANSVLQCGETDALFAGPHTVSFHRSTLLIAAATSFFNAGSGTNQSNHYYCTGPIHHGILERGCKTGSNSYVKWPARIGQFSVISGSHSNHPDTSDLPFSYLFGNNGVTQIIPAANIKTCGMMRDVLKWRGRDGRDPSCRKLDIINYEEFTPYSAERMFRAIEVLERIRRGVVRPAELHFEISPFRISEGIRLYHLGIRYFFGMALTDRILSMGESDGLKELLSSGKEGTDVSVWVDMAGMIAPRSVTDALCRRIAAGEFGSLDEVQEALERIHADYEEYRWLYVRDKLCKVFQIQSPELNEADLAEMVRSGSDAAQEFRRMRASDAQKDFGPDMQVGFGIDHPELAQEDFLNSLGSAEENPHVMAVNEHYDRDVERAEQALRWLKRCRLRPVTLSVPD